MFFCVPRFLSKNNDNCPVAIQKSLAKRFPLMFKNLFLSGFCGSVYSHFLFHFPEFGKSRFSFNFREFVCVSLTLQSLMFCSSQKFVILELEEEIGKFPGKSYKDLDVNATNQLSTLPFCSLKVLSDENQGGSKVVSIASSFFTV
jgi:hypothetical protein